MSHAHEHHHTPTPAVDAHGLHSQPIADYFKEQLSDDTGFKPASIEISKSAYDLAKEAGFPGTREEFDGAIIGAQTAPELDVVKVAENVTEQVVETPDELPVIDSDETGGAVDTSDWVDVITEETPADLKDAPAEEEHLATTTAPDGRLVAMTIQNSSGQILRTLWQAPPLAAVPEDWKHAYKEACTTKRKKINVHLDKDTVLRVNSLLPQSLNQNKLNTWLLALNEGHLALRSDPEKLKHLAALEELTQYVIGLHHLKNEAPR